MARNEDVYVFDTYFYFQLTRKGEKSGWESVKRWTKHLNIFSKRKLLIPINFSSQKYCHWLLICVHMDEKKICYYNSAKGAVDQKEYMSNILNYLFEERLNRLKSILNISEWHLDDISCPVI